MFRPFLACVALFFLSASTTSSTAQSGRPAVDIALVMAIDVSISVTEPRWELQKRGYAEAFANPSLVARIRSGSIGAIAVTVVQWSNCHQRAHVIGWTIIDSSAAALAFSEQIGQMPRAFSGWTCPAAAIEFSAELLASAPVEARRLVIDISGDGQQNADFRREKGDVVSTAEVRDDIVSRGITINGLALRIPFGDPYFEYGKFVVPFYQESVIGGPGAFLLTVEDANDEEKFTLAIKKKLEMELSAQLLP